jgi:hypothetical protein
MNIEEEIKKLISSTTILEIRDKCDNIIFGDEHNVSRFQSNQGNQDDLTQIEESWQSKWDSFNGWIKERQKYRFFYDDFKIFYYSFLQLRINKVDSINEKDRKKLLYYNNLCGVNLYNLYNHGKKCIDLIKNLKLELTLPEEKVLFIKRFSETRNKFFAHNLNPRGYDFMFEPEVWKLFETNSFLEIIFHGNNEHEYTAKIDYYEDYYMLDNVLMKIIKSFQTITV